jgi:hypothetical protein
VKSNVGPGGIPDANPEAVIIGTPLDKTKNPDVAIGTKLSNITGVVVYQYVWIRLITLLLFMGSQIWIFLRPALDSSHRNIFASNSSVPHKTNVRQ